MWTAVYQVNLEFVLRPMEWSEVTLTRSSGDPLLDRSAQTAIYKASPLPVPTDSETFNLFRDISLTVRPEQVRG